MGTILLALIVGIGVTTVANVYLHRGVAHRWYEIDPGWLVIKPLTWLRLARVRLSELRLAPSQKPITPAGAA